jgi:hypothetical protein
VVIDVPLPGNETITSFEVELDGANTDSGHFEIKKQGDTGSSGG